MAAYQSWNGYPAARHRGVVPLWWRSDLPRLEAIEGTVLPYGAGRSYGDTCLNDDGVLLDTRGLSRFITFDQVNGRIRCEAGVTMGEILEVAVPRHWFLAVTPGTRHVTVGGAIAHDVHGKNHHVLGTFGCHVRRLELARSDGSVVDCSPNQHQELYRATIGGMGLTGLILSAELALQPVPGTGMRVREDPFGSLEEFWDASAAADSVWPYTVAWIDGFATGPRAGRGVLIAGAHDDAPSSANPVTSNRLPGVPFTAPPGTLNRVSIALFNRLYYRAHARPRAGRVPFPSFFYPLDRLPHWNRLYGRYGFFQHQSVVPAEAAPVAVRRLLDQMAASHQPPFLAVLKRFGEHRSPGILSFPRPGVTLAVDLPNRGARTLRLLDQLDRVVLDAGGAVYPAKDARMSRATFRASFPGWEAFARLVDPRFSSGFWRRVT